MGPTRLRASRVVESACPEGSVETSRQLPRHQESVESCAQAPTGGRGKVDSSGSLCYSSDIDKCQEDQDSRAAHGRGQTSFFEEIINLMNIPEGSWSITEGRGCGNTDMLKMLGLSHPA